MEKTIGRIVEYAGKVADPITIYLFGSMASGTHNEYSDLDLLIVTDEETSSKQIAELIKSYAAQYCLFVDVLVYSKNRLEEVMEQPNSFVATILENAKVAYKKKLTK